MDPVAAIRACNAGREPERLALKFRAMRQDALSFLRGSCHLFYARLAVQGALKDAPSAWACGDLHLENFGSYKGDDRRVCFDLNDFDEAALAPSTWDLVRLLASLDVAGASLARSDAELAALVSAVLEAYCAGLLAGNAMSIEASTARGLVGALLDGLQQRNRATFLDKRSRIVGRTRVLRVDNGKALPATQQQQDSVRSFIAGWARAQPEPAFFEVLDVARRIAGLGSLGVERYVILVAGKGSPDRNYLLDLKQALPSALAPFLPKPQPPWHDDAQRITTAERSMQAAPAAFLHAVQVNHAPFVLSGLQPSEDRLTLSRTTQSLGALLDVAATMGRLLAWAQLRAAGQRGADAASALIGFTRDRAWRTDVVDASHACAAQVRADFASYCAAYDGGRLKAAA